VVIIIIIQYSSMLLVADLNSLANCIEKISPQFIARCYASNCYRPKFSFNKVNILQQLHKNGNKADRVIYFKGTVIVTAAPSQIQICYWAGSLISSSVYVHTCLTCSIV